MAACRHCTSAPVDLGNTYGNDTRAGPGNHNHTSCTERKNTAANRPVANGTAPLEADAETRPPKPPDATGTAKVRPSKPPDAPPQQQVRPPKPPDAPPQQQTRPPTRLRLPRLPPTQPPLRLASTSPRLTSRSNGSNGTRRRTSMMLRSGTHTHFFLRIYSVFALSRTPARTSPRNTDSSFSNSTDNKRFSSSSVDSD